MRLTQFFPRYTIWEAARCIAIDKGKRIIGITQITRRSPFLMNYGYTNCALPELRLTLCADLHAKFAQLNHGAGNGS